VSPHERLWEAVRGEQDRARVRARYLASARARRPIGRPATRNRRPRRLWWASAALLPAMAAVALWTALRRSPPADLTFIQADGQVGRVGETIAAPPVAPWPLKFSDGSVVSLYAGSHARVSAVNAAGARIVLDRGGASASVVHRGGSRWVIDAGPFEVLVSGTRFEVNWDSDDEVFGLDLEEGSVLVSGPCMPVPRSVARGDHLRLSCGSKHETADGIADPAEGAHEAVLPHPESGATSEWVGPMGSGAAATTAGPTRARVATRAASTPASVLQTDAWRRLVDAGRYREALDLVERRGFEPQCRPAPGADLLDLGDVARFAGDARRARQGYLAARDKLPGGGRSAYGLGLIAFDQERDFAGAAQWFETYLVEQPEGGLQREAAGRAMEAWHLAGEGTRARAAAQRYLRLYPDGLQARLARQLATGF
jgi:transmembrane sensor